MTKAKIPREKIPPATQLKLWVVTAGRCEFPGCNKFLLTENLTLKEDNYSNIAHIVPVSEKFPRGHPLLSKELATDFSNLMLLCPTHHKLIDGKNSDDYPVELLRQYKVRHEERIKVQTEIQEDHTTTILRFMAKIGDQQITIPIAQANKAIIPNYPSDEKGITIDLTNIDISDDDSYWKLMMNQTQTELSKHFATGNNNKKINHVSIFAIGPIPLLIYLGYCLGNVVPSDIYQRHRDSQDWTWKSNSPDNFNFHLEKSGSDKLKEIALVLSLSGKIHSNEVSEATDKKLKIYEITIDNPGLDFLKTNNQVEKFRSIYRQTITEIREKFGNDTTIHLFPAIPSPLALVCGKELLQKVDPTIIVYQKNQIDNKFSPKLTLNSQTKS